MNNTVTIYEFIGLILENKPPKKIFIKDGADLGEWYLHIENETIEYSNNKYNTINKLDWNYYIENQKQDILVAILPEKNDDGEWEDIKEIKYKNKKVYNEKTNSYNTLNSKDKNIYIPILNQLIKNQKYLKERLDKNDCAFEQEKVSFKQYINEKLESKDE